MFLAAAFALVAPNASAATISFTSGPDGPAAVTAADEDAPIAVELVRAGAVIARSDAGSAQVAALAPGDTARAYRDGILVASAPYDGTPALGDVCVGSSSFTVSRPPADRLFVAGAESADGDIETTVSVDAPAVASTARPLTAGDTAYAGATGLADDTVVITYEAVRARACTTPPPAAGTTGPTTPGGAAKRAALSVAAARARLRRVGLRGLARRGSVTLAFRFPEPGTVRLRVLGARGRPIAAGRRRVRRDGTARVLVRISASGRRFLRRSAHRKLTLRATFTPSRARAAPRRASVRFTLRARR